MKTEPETISSIPHLRVSGFGRRTGKVRASDNRRDGGQYPLSVYDGKTPL
ncbi:hypothetical protein JHJ32_07720 [Parapedobacter sp. ISTM3]|nr:hypothetical protein [Parapedobacter sp. ISTM3]MBK1439866.1 hypothetical protein [Parapedobacter sp. ISTM3]